MRMPMTQWDASFDSSMPDWYVYAADDALQNLCTQGNCTIYTATDECTAKLTELCSGGAQYPNHKAYTKNSGKRPSIH